MSFRALRLDLCWTCFVRHSGRHTWACIIQGPSDKGSVHVTTCAVVSVLAQEGPAPWAIESQKTSPSPVYNDVAMRGTWRMWTRRCWKAGLPSGGIGVCKTEQTHQWTSTLETSTVTKNLQERNSGLAAKQQQQKQEEPIV